MWSLGCVLYEMCALQLAFPADNFVNLIQSICRGSYRQPLLPYSQCCGSGMFIPDPNFFHHGSRVKKLPDPGSASASKNLSILTQNIVSKLSEILSGMFVPDPDFDFLPIPDPVVKKASDPGSGSATLLICNSPHKMSYIHIYSVTPRWLFKILPKINTTDDK
jgi:hypothetical protein